MILSKFMSDSGERMLWLVIIVLGAWCMFMLRRAYFRWINNPFRIIKKVWYSGGLKMSVSIQNVRNKIVEIDTPIIEFCHPRLKRRKFKIITPGNNHLFPLGLSPQTNYDFLVEFTKLYEREQILREYRKVAIIINDRKGKLIAKKNVKISMPK